MLFSFAKDTDYNAFLDSANKLSIKLGDRVKPSQDDKKFIRFAVFDSVKPEFKYVISAGVGLSFVIFGCNVFLSTLSIIS